MKILKYLIYLILLLGIGGAILISTDKGVYTLSATKKLDIPQEMVYDAIRNWDNWKNWHERWTEDPTTSLHSESKTLEWVSKNNLYEKGFAKFTKSIPHTTLEFESDIQTSSGNMHQKNKIKLERKDNTSTLVHWDSEVTLSFGQKLKKRLGKGKQYIESETEMFLSSLDALANILTQEMEKHHSEVVGMTIIPETNYIHTATNSTKTNFIPTAINKINQLYQFAEQYGIPIIGSPEVIIHKRENNQKNFLFSVALPLPEGYELNLENPEFVIGTFEIQSVLKTTLVGNYKYWDETLELGIEYLEKQRLVYPLEEGIILKWTNFKDQPVNPAKWLTEIYIPAYEPETLIIP